MSNPVIEALQRLVPTTRTSSKGFIQLHCPSCGDKKLRGGILFSSDDGFGYHCFNAGCELGSFRWVPGNGFYGRPRKLFQLLGGSISDIPTSMLMSKQILYNQKKELVVARDFEAVEMPAGHRLLWEEPATQDMKDAQFYVLRRGSLFVEYPFFWSPRLPRYVIYPFEYHKKIIGWIARAIDEDNTRRHVKCANFPTDYMLNQENAYRDETVFVQEGTFDAIALNSLCTFGSTVSKKQTNLLKNVKARRRKIVLLPDQKGDEWIGFWNTARANGFLISVPEYPTNGHRLKDVGESIKQNGLLLTIEAVVNGITDNHLAAYERLKEITTRRG